MQAQDVQSAGQAAQTAGQAAQTAGEAAQTAGQAAQTAGQAAQMSQQEFQETVLQTLWDMSAELSITGKKVHCLEDRLVPWRLCINELFD